MKLRQRLVVAQANRIPGQLVGKVQWRGAVNEARQFEACMAVKGKCVTSAHIVQAGGKKHESARQ